MNITYRKLLDAKSAIEGLLALSPAPTARLAAQIARNVRLVDQALKDFNQAHQLMLKPFAGEDGQVAFETLMPERQAALNVEFQELLDTETALELHPLRMADVAHVEELRPQFTIPISTFYLADFMFTDEDAG